MTRGIYTAATGMLAEEAAQQVIAQNLANASTTGYKQEVPTFKTFDETLISLVSDTGVDAGATAQLGSGATLDKIYTDLSDGPLQSTGNNLDVAMVGSAYLGVQTPSGTLYSRDGSLTLNAQGTLVQAGTGLPVLSSAGTPISIPSGDPVSISANGTVSQGKNEIAKLGLYSITNADDPQKVGDNLISTPVPATKLDGDSSNVGFVRSGFLEASNVSVVKQMVTMIACQRSYEANSKALQSQDTMNQQSISTVGTPAS